MSLDADNDSQMLSSPSTTPSSTGPSTPPTNPTTTLDTSSSNISPPDSQHRQSKMSNANGKRPLNTISNGPDEDNEVELLSAGPQAGKARQELPLKTHVSSGYTWRRPEDEPGWSWMNKKAVDEAGRAWDALVHKDSMVKGRFGDPFEMADREKAVANSLKHK